MSNTRPERKEDVMNKGLIFPTVIAAMILSGCSGEQSTLSKIEKDKIYIETVRDKYPKLVGSDSMLLQLADASCEAFDSGASQSDIVNIIRSKGGTVGVELGFAVGAAVPIYCPEHNGKI